MTNETLHTLETRRSCRAYKPEQITKEELKPFCVQAPLPPAP